MSRIPPTHAGSLPRRFAERNVAAIDRPAIISFDAANPRYAHECEEFETLTLADDTVILPGVIDTLTNVVEHPRLVAQRIECYAALVGLERVSASTDCRFGTFLGSGHVGARVAETKLQALAKGTRLASTALSA